MIRAIGEFLSGLAPKRDRFAEDDHRVAAAALILHTMRVDGREVAAERAKLEAMMRTRFGLEDRLAAAVVAEADRRQREAADVSGFAAVLRRALPAEGRALVVEMLWEIARADGATDEFEESTVLRIGELIEAPPPGGLPR